MTRTGAVHLLHTPCTQVDLVDRVVFPLPGSVQPAALLLDDIDGDGDNEIVVGANDGSLTFFKGRCTVPLHVLTGFGPIVAVAHRHILLEQPEAQQERLAKVATPTQPRSLLRTAHSDADATETRAPATGATPPARGSRLLVVNSEGDLLILEVSRTRARALAAAADHHVALEEGRIDEPGAPHSARGPSSLHTSDDEATTTAAHDSAEWAESEEMGGEGGGGGMPALGRREAYVSSTFLASYQRFRVPINVSSMECCDLQVDGRLTVVLGTLDCSMHVFNVLAERPAEELALEAALAAAAAAREAAALAAAKEEEAAAAAASALAPRPGGRLGTNVASVPTSYSPLLLSSSGSYSSATSSYSALHSRRPSLTHGGSSSSAANQLSQLGQPLLPASASGSAGVSHADSPVARGRVLSNHFSTATAAAITASAQQQGQQLPPPASPSRSKSPFGGPSPTLPTATFLPPQPVLHPPILARSGSSGTSVAPGTGTGGGTPSSASAASSATHTRTSSPTLSISSILTSINPPKDAKDATLSPPRSQSATPSLAPEPAPTPHHNASPSPMPPSHHARSSAQAPVMPPPKVTWIMRLELQRQLIKLPHPVHSLSSVSGDRVAQDLLHRTDSTGSLMGFELELPPSAVPDNGATADDLSMLSPSATAPVETLSVASDHPRLLPLLPIDTCTMQVLPSRVFQRSQALQKRQARAGSVISVPPGPTAATARAISNSVSTYAHTANPAYPHSASTNSLYTLGSSVGTNAGLPPYQHMQLQPPQRGGDVSLGASPALNPRPVPGSRATSGIMGVLLQQQQQQQQHQQGMSASASPSTFSSRKNSGAQGSSVATSTAAAGAIPSGSPPMLGGGGVNSSPRFGAQLSVGGGGGGTTASSSFTNSPRFSFMSASQANASQATYALNQAAAAAAAQQQQQQQQFAHGGLYSLSVTASPALAALSASGPTPPSQGPAPGGSPPPPAFFSLGTAAAATTTMMAGEQTASMLSLSRTLLLVALEEGALLVDVANNLVWALGFPLPGASAIVSPSAVPTTLASPARMVRTNSAGSVFGGSSAGGAAGGLGSSASLHSIAPSPTPSASMPSATPPLAPDSTTNAGGLARSPAAILSNNAIPTMKRTVSAPVDTTASTQTSAATSPGGDVSAPLVVGLSPPVHVPTSLSQSSTPLMRPSLHPPSTGAPRPLQPVAGINLTALNNVVSEPPSVIVTPTPSTLTLSVPNGSADASTPVHTPAVTPSSRSMSNSREVSYAMLPNLVATPVFSPQQQPPTSTAGGKGQRSSGGQGGHMWDVVRTRMRGDLMLPASAPPSASSESAPGAPSRSGVLAMVDALGRLSVQHLSAQLVPSAAGTSVDEQQQPLVPQSRSSDYHYALQLPGQFLALSSLPMPTHPHHPCGPDALSPNPAPTTSDSTTTASPAGEMLTACGLDGSVYFIPTMPLRTPPPPSSLQQQQTAGSDTAISGAGFTISRFHYPARIAAFCSGLYSLDAGHPTAALLFVNFQHELILFPDALTAAPCTEWTQQWAWQAATPAGATSVTVEVMDTPASTATPLEVAGKTPSVEGLTDSTSPRTADAGDTAPSYYLAIQSTRRTLMDAWREHDRDRCAGPLARQEALPATALPKLFEWSSSARPAASRKGSGATSGARSASASASASSLPGAPATDVAPYVHDLLNVDLPLLHEYRALLRRRLGLEDERVGEGEAEGDMEGQAEGDADGRGGRHGGGWTDAANEEQEAEGPVTQPQPYTQHANPHTPQQTPRTPARAPGSAVYVRTPSTPAAPNVRGPTGSPGPGYSSPSLLRSPLFASFKLQSHHFAARPLSLTSRLASEPTQGGCAPPSLSTDAGATGSQRPAGGLNEQSPGFWRKLLRRTQ